MKPDMNLSYLVSLNFFFIILTAFVAYFLPKYLSADLYIEAWWYYDVVNTRFDNTYLTYVTDYILAILTGGGALYIYLSCGASVLRNRCCGLLMCYCASVTMGGITHQFFFGVKDLNTIAFRISWSICVGFVTLAGAFIGSVGNNLAQIASSSKQTSFFDIIIFPGWFWIFWGIFLTACVLQGAMSMKRPAADIFIAGITQTIPSTYVFLVLLSKKWVVQISMDDQKGVSLGKILMMVGFYFNAPLLPLYPILVSYNLNLGVINAILHFWLSLAWGMQCIGMMYFCKAFPSSSSIIASHKKK